MVPPFAIRVPQSALDDSIDHFRHVLAPAGIHHVGMTSGFDGGATSGWQDASETRNVTAATHTRGGSNADIAMILGGNLLRVSGEVVRNASRE
ncbi:MAG: membrane dipeptidase [Rhodanobacter sp.]